MHGRHLWALISAFMLLGMLYIYAIPNFEAPDELYHVGVVHHIRTTGELPVQQTGVETFYRQEGSQPPLYYLTVAALTLPFDWTDYPALLQFNPHANIGKPGLPGNKNRVLHAPVYPPDLSGATLALRVSRLISLLCGAVTVYAVYAAARTLTPARPAVAYIAAGITAFNPQFLFIAASVNNDNLVTALNSVIVWQMLVMLRDGFERRRGLLLAVLLALASLSKLSGLVLMPVTALAALWTAYRTRNRRGLLELGVMVVGVWGVLAGWWYARNIMLYDELFGTERMLAIFGRREMTVDLAQLLGEFEGLWLSYWGVFGWFSILTETAFYRVVDAVAVVAVLGLAVHLWRARGKVDYGVRVFLLSLLLSLGLGSLISWTLQTPASQGRLLFPYIAATSTLFALGLREVRVPRGVVVPLGLFAAAVPFITIIPAYEAPRRLMTLPAEAVPVDLNFGDVRLVGYNAPDARLLPGDALSLTLYWQAQAVSPADYTVSIEIALPDSTVIGGEDTFPGWGSLRTTAWEPGTIYADHYRIRLDQNVTGAGVLRANLNLWDFPNGQFLPITTGDGARLDEAIVPVGAFGVLNADLPADAITTPDVDFGGVFALRGYRLEDDNTLTLWWETLTPPTLDYRVIAAVVAGSEILVQGDAPPDVPTGFFERGDRFQTQHMLVRTTTEPFTAQPLFIGWYDPATLTRLPRSTRETLYPLLELTRP